jgi:hypothetical protein
VNWKEPEKKRSWPNLSYYPDIRVEGLGKPTKTSAILSGPRTEILTQDFQNVKEEC